MRDPTLFAVAAVLTLAVGGYVYWRHMLAAPPEGLESANGRIEVTRVDIASKLAGRVAQVRVKEGDSVQKGELIAELDTAELEARLAAAKAAVSEQLLSHLRNPEFQIFYHASVPADAGRSRRSDRGADQRCLGHSFVIGITGPRCGKRRAGPGKTQDIMITRRQANIGLLSAAWVAAAGVAEAAGPETKVVQLPPPRMAGGKPLMEALKLRRSTREYSNRSLDLQVLSDLLWSADGINRPTGDRTAPYWRHIMVIDIFAVMENGAWLYDPKDHFARRCSIPRPGHHAICRSARKTVSRPRICHPAFDQHRPPRRSDQEPSCASE